MTAPGCPCVGCCRRGPLAAIGEARRLILDAMGQLVEATDGNGFARQALHEALGDLDDAARLIGGER